MRPQYLPQYCRCPEAVLPVAAVHSYNIAVHNPDTEAVRNFAVHSPDTGAVHNFAVHSPAD